jgi:hypothetical protein
MNREQTKFIWSSVKICNPNVTYQCQAADFPEAIYTLYSTPYPTNINLKSKCGIAQATKVAEGKNLLSYTYNFPNDDPIWANVIATDPKDGEIFIYEPTPGYRNKSPVGQIIAIILIPFVVVGLCAFIAVVVVVVIIVRRNKGYVQL